MHKSIKPGDRGKQDAIYVEDLYDENVALRAEVKQLQDERAKREADFAPLLDEILRLRTLLRRLYEWDHMDAAADGTYWRNEINRTLGSDSGA